jgi:hypothetical protein
MNFTRENHRVYYNFLNLYSVKYKDIIFRKCTRNRCFSLKKDKNYTFLGISFKLIFPVLELSYITTNL